MLTLSRCCPCAWPGAISCSSMSDYIPPCAGLRRLLTDATSGGCRKIVIHRQPGCISLRLALLQRDVERAAGNPVRADVDRADLEADYAVPKPIMPGPAERRLLATPEGELGQEVLVRVDDHRLSFPRACGMFGATRNGRDLREDEDGWIGADVPEQFSATRPSVRRERPSGVEVPVVLGKALEETPRRIRCPARKPATCSTCRSRTGRCGLELAPRIAANGKPPNSTGRAPTRSNAPDLRCTFPTGVVALATRDRYRAA